MRDPFIQPDRDSTQRGESDSRAARGDQRRSNGPPKRPLLTLTLAAVALLVFWVEGGAPRTWVYDRVAILDGEWWRLLTGHVSHSGLHHAIWDIAALIIIGGLIEPRCRPQLVVATLAGILAIDTYLLWGLPTLHYYAGLSGLINTWLVLLLADLYRLGQRGLVWLLGLGYLAKLLGEAVTGQALLTDTNWPTLPYVHLVGALAGLFVLWIDSLIRTPAQAGRNRG